MRKRCLWYITLKACHISVLWITLISCILFIKLFLNLDFNCASGLLVAILMQKLDIQEVSTINLEIISKLSEDFVSCPEELILACEMLQYTGVIKDFSVFLTAAIDYDANDAVRFFCAV